MGKQFTQWKLWNMANVSASRSFSRLINENPLHDGYCLNQPCRNSRFSDYTTTVINWVNTTRYCMYTNSVGQSKSDLNKYITYIFTILNTSSISWHHNYRYIWNHMQTINSTISMVNPRAKRCHETPLAAPFIHSATGTRPQSRTWPCEREKDASATSGRLHGWRTRQGRNSWWWSTGVHLHSKGELWWLNDDDTMVKNGKIIMTWWLKDGWWYDIWFLNDD